MEGKAIGGAMAAMMFLGAFAGMGMVDSDPVMAAKVITISLSPALLMLAGMGLSKAGHGIAHLWRRYIEYSREQAEQEYVCLAVRRMRG